MSARQLFKYAASLENTTKFGDETVISAMSLLATFKNIQGPVFKKTTALALDLSEAMGTDLKSSMIQLGKALNDPKTGLTMLNRVGITFSEQQKERIYQLVEENKLMEAQGIILKNISGQFGGQATAAAKTYKGALLQLKNAYGSVKEEIGMRLMPTAKAFVVKMKEWLIENQQTIGIWAGKVMSFAEMAKDAFVEFARYMKTDWRGSIKWVFDSFLQLLQTTFKSAVILSIAAGKGIWEGLNSAILGKGERQISRTTDEMYEAAGGKYGTRQRKNEGGIWNVSNQLETYRLDEQLYQKYRKQAQEQYQNQIVKGALGDTVSQVAKEWKRTGDSISKNMPRDMADRMRVVLDDHRKRLADLLKSGGAYASGTGSGARSGGGDDTTKPGIAVGPGQVVRGGFGELRRFGFDSARSQGTPRSQRREDQKKMNEARQTERFESSKRRLALAQRAERMRFRQAKALEKLVTIMNKPEMLAAKITVTNFH